MWISAIKFGSVSVSESCNNLVLSMSEAKTVSRRDSSVEGASCSTAPTLKVLGISILPPSIINSFKINLNKVVFPAPFLPTIQT